MKPSDIQKEVKLTMSSLDRIRKASAPSDFIDTLTTKMIFSEEQVRWVNRTKLALAAMVALAILNGVLMFRSKVDQREYVLDSIAQQYYLNGDL